MLDKVEYELVDVRGMKTEADSWEYRADVPFADEIVASDIRLSLSDILSSDVYLCRDQSAFCEWS
jgi:hypothetical protein